MTSLNKVFLIGNLGKEPEISSTQSGQSVATFTITTNDKHKNMKNELEDRTEWYNIVLSGKLSDIASEYIHKGKTVYIEGRLQTLKWEWKDGKTRYTTEVIVDSIQMLSAKRENDGSQTLALYNYNRE